MFRRKSSDFSADLQEETWALCEVDLFTKSILFDVISSHTGNKQDNQEILMAVKEQLSQEEKYVLGISHRDVLNNTVTLLSITWMSFLFCQNSIQKIKIFLIKATCKVYCTFSYSL